LLLEYPVLMQRPIFVVDDRAVICRPSEKALELL
jgi:arsenate reductase-like glutaredoxin family protein